MRNRLDVTYRGKRTTARFPGYLWRLALIATGASDDAMASRLRTVFDDITDLDYVGWSASQIVLEYLIDTIEVELTLVGFNPDSSRAPVPGRSPAPGAAEARRTKDEQ